MQQSSINVGRALYQSTVTHLAQKSLAIMESKGSASLPQKPAITLYTKPPETGLLLHTPFSQNLFRFYPPLYAHEFQAMSPHKRFK